LIFIHFSILPQISKKFIFFTTSGAVLQLQQETYMDIPGQTPETQSLINFLSRDGYENLHSLDDGTVVGTSELMFTRAVYIGLNFSGWEKRFCFEDRNLAVVELRKLQDGDSEPSGWIARR
jgi:hypothetical protein